MLTRTSRQDVRVAGLFVVANIGGDPAIEALLDGLHDPGIDVRCTAAMLLGTRLEAGSFSRVCELAETGPVDAAMAAVFAMERMLAPAAAASLCRLAADPSRPMAVRAQAVESLGRREEHSAVGALAPLVEDERIVPVELLGQRRDESVARRVAEKRGANTGDARERTPGTLADVAAAALTAITGQDCGYCGDLDRAGRARARACWERAARSAAVSRERDGAAGGSP